MTDDQGIDIEIIRYNKKLKKGVLDVLFQHASTFYIHCLPDPRLMIGKRGLVEKEKDEGIIFVFGPYSTRSLSWDDDFIFCEMQFSSWERVQVPFECIARVFDKAGQVIMQWTTHPSGQANQETEPPDSSKEEHPTKKKSPATGGSDSRVIEIDFSKKKGKGKDG